MTLTCGFKLFRFKTLQEKLHHHVVDCPYFQCRLKIHLIFNNTNIFLNICKVFFVCAPSFSPFILQSTHPTPLQLSLELFSYFFQKCQSSVVLVTKRFSYTSLAQHWAGRLSMEQCLVVVVMILIRWSPLSLRTKSLRSKPPRMLSLSTLSLLQNVLTNRYVICELIIMSF